MDTKTYLSGPKTAIEKRERILAAFVTLLPLVAVAFAIFGIAQNGIGLLEIGLFLPFYILGEIGAEVGHHRYFSHRAFKAAQPLKLLLVVLASASGKGSIFEFAAVHRRHHLYGDQEGDPHSPHLSGKDLLGRIKGFWHSYYGWIYRIRMNPAEHARVLDLIQDPVLRRWGSRNMYYVWLLVGLAVPSFAGWVVTGTPEGVLTGLIWGGGVRLFFEQHTAFAINAICHLWGQRPYITKDQSRNNPIIAYLTLGVGWHNNHHAFPFTSSNQFHWWQLDPCGWFIKSCEKMGLCSDLKFPTPAQLEKRGLVD